MRIRILQGAAIAALGLLATVAAQAQVVWSGAVSASYNVGGNWVGGVVPVNNGTATIDFPIPSTQISVLLSTNENVQGIVFSGTSGFSSYDLQSTGSGSITIGAGGISSQAGLSSYNSFSLPVILSANQTWDGTEGFVVAYSGVSETGGPRTLTTLGTVYLLGPGTFTGGIDVSNASYLNVEGSATGTGLITLSNGATLNAYYGISLLPNAVTLQGDATLGSQGTAQYGDFLELDGPITLSTTTPTISVNQGIVVSKGSITAPAGTMLTLSGPSSKPARDGGGLMVVSGPTSSGVTGLTLNSIAVILDPSLSASTAFSSIQGNSLVMQNFAYLGLDGTYAAPGAVSTFLSSNAVSLASGSFSGTLGFDTYAGGSDNVFVDPIDVSGIASSTFLGLASSTSATLAASAIITPHANQYTFGGGGGTLTVFSPLVDNGGTPRSLVMTNAPGQLTLRLEGTNTYTGPTASYGGVLIFDSNTPPSSIQDLLGYVGYTEQATNITNAQQFVDQFDTSDSSGVIGFDSTNISSPRTITGNIDLSAFTAQDPFIGTATVATIGSMITPAHGHYQFTGVKGGALTVTSQLSDPSAGVVIGLLDPIEANESVSSVTMSGDNGYGQGTIFNSGVLYVTTGNALSYGAVTVPNNGTAAVAPVLAAINGDVAISNNISVATFLDDTTKPGLFLGNPTTSDLLTLNGVISDDGSTGTIGIQGHVALTNANTYSGDTYFTNVGTNPGNGVAYVSNNAAFSTGTIHVLTDAAIVPLGGNVTLANPVDLQFTLTLGQSGNSNMLTLSGPISSNGLSSTSLDIESNVTLSGSNTFGGQVIVNNALLVIGSANALGSSSVTLNNSTTQYGYSNPLIEDLSGDSNSVIDLAPSQVLTLDVPAGNSFSFQGAITGDASDSVVKTGAGAQYLYGASSYGAGTTVSAGTLVAGNNLALGTGTINVSSGATLGVGPSATLTNPISVASGATIGGSGTFSPVGGVTIGGGMIVQPYGATTNLAVGNLSFGTPLTFGPTGVYNFDVMTASGAAGVDYGTITVSGAFNVTATPGSPFTLNVKSFVPGSQTAGLASFSATLAYSWTILSAGSITGFSPSDFSINTSAFQNPTLGGGFSLAQVGNTLTLDFTPVPEPSTWALIAAGAGLLFLGVRRRARA